MANPLLFVRVHNFPGDGYSYWSEQEHAWGSLSAATVYTLDERRSVERDGKGNLTYVCRNSKTRRYIPTEGEFEELPDLLKMKTVDEWLADMTPPTNGRFAEP